MSPVRIRIWLKNGEFLKTSIDFDDVMAINKAHGKVKAGVIRNENLKITISNITFHFDDIEEAMCCYDYQYTEHSISTVTIEERGVIEEELTEIYKMFAEEKEDLFSSDVCIVGDNEIDMNEVEHIAYKRI